MSDGAAGGRKAKVSALDLGRSPVSGERPQTGLARKLNDRGRFPGSERSDELGPSPQYALTPRQRRVLQAIEAFRHSRGYSPTLREIADAVGLASVSTVSYYLSHLQDKGYLSRGEGRPRTRSPPSSRQRTSSRCPGNWSGRGTSSCSKSPVTQ